MTTTLLLLRHAAHAHVGRMLTGRLPGIGLGDAGRAQAARLAERLSREAPVALHVSPRERATETAAIIGARLHLSPHRSEGLDEIDFGAWTGCAFDTLAADPRWRHWNARRGEARAPGGETMAEAGARAEAAIQAICAEHAGGTVLLVSHADVIKAILMAQLGLPLDRHDRLDIAPASISRIQRWEGGGRVTGLNEVIA